MGVKAADRRRRRKSGLSRALLLLLLAGVTGIVAVSVFFRISTISAAGNSKYTAEEIIAASEIEIGGNLFSMRDSSVAINIRKALPYVDKVKVVRDLPDGVTIVVEESYPLASVNVDSTWYIVDRNMRILDQTDIKGAQSTIQIRGIEPIQPRVGDKIALGDAGAAQLSYLADTLSAILSAGIEGDIDELDAENLSSFVFDYDGRFKVSMCTDGDAAAKISLLLSIVSELEPSDSGEITISSEIEARFVPA